jgi:hypothetical protein
MIKGSSSFISKLLDLSQKYSLILETGNSTDLKYLPGWDKEESFSSSEDNIFNLNESH